MKIRVPDWSDLKRTRVLALVLLLGFVVAIPVPLGDLTSKKDVALLLMWVGSLASAWALWFQRGILDLFVVVALIGGILTFLFEKSFLNLTLILIWRVWFYYREKRILKTHLAVLVFMGSFLFSPCNVFAQSDSSLIGDNASYLKGYKINDFTSCRMVDVVPWSLNEDNRQARLLLRDQLRLSSEVKYSDWSIFQTMDTDGSVTFIFERLQSDGSREYFLTKGSVFNRIVKRGKTKSVAEMKKLTNLIDSPALEFYHKDGSRLSFLPGSSGSSKLRFYLAPRPGARILPPLYLEGRHCSRPESAFDQDDDSGKSGGGIKMPSAPIAGGASSAGGSKSEK